MCTKGEEDLEEEEEEVQEGVEGEQDSPVSLQPSGSHIKQNLWVEGEQDSPVSLHPSGSHTKPTLWGGGRAGQSCLSSSFR
jgi:hypothetical protein